ncbi:MAG: outer membrane lipoprotein carrier protein LolA [Cytophagales bacterium]|jgi:outer membrane lipoprotein-sorting protein|nr:outer membrane lipoprotein carrier protein LolA [Cytophagales bacterium]
MFINFFLATAIVASQNLDIPKLLQKISYEKFQVEFKYDYHEEDESKHENGILSFYKNQYRISFPDREIIYNGKKMWNYDKNSNTVNVVNDPEGNDNPLLLFTNYKNFFEPKDCVKEDDFYRLTMIPKNKKDDDIEIEYFEILCDNESIQQLKIFNKDGSWMNVRFYHWNTKINFPKNFFIFDAKKNNAKVVELD